MIRQPEYGTRNMTDSAYAFEGRQIARLNEVLGDVELTREEERSLVWLCGWEESTLVHIISAFRKAGNLANERREQLTDRREV